MNVPNRLKRMAIGRSDVNSRKRREAIWGEQSSLQGKRNVLPSYKVTQKNGWSSSRK